MGLPIGACSIGHTMSRPEAYPLIPAQWAVACSDTAGCYQSCITRGCKIDDLANLGSGGAPDLKGLDALQNESKPLRLDDENAVGQQKRGAMHQHQHSSAHMW